MICSELKKKRRLNQCAVYIGRYQNQSKLYSFKGIYVYTLLSRPIKIFKKQQKKSACIENWLKMAA